MLFNSVQFLIFFPIVCFIILFSTYVIKRNIVNQILLLAASLYFYMCWNPVYIVLILISVGITYASGLFIENKTAKVKKIILLVSLISNLGILFFFKYANFIADSIYYLFHVNHADNTFNILLPVGISFYTFQALGYSIDVYRGTIKAERNFITYALFVTFFPQLVAGPIERSLNLLPQFKVNYRFNYNRVTDGLKLAAWGMFKKVVVADTLAIYVNAVFSNTTSFNSVTICCAVFFFAFQILCDFSGYSDIAIGCAKILGFDLMQNFRSPYLAHSITDFWRRWHISLSTWFKDYVYIPLGGNRTSPIKHYRNLMVTFLLSGLWHGAAWHFVFWGFLHGIYQVVETARKSTRKGVENTIAPKQNYALSVLKTLFTFCLVCIAWIFFRANSIQESFFVISKIIALPQDIAHFFSVTLYQEGIKDGIKNLFSLNLQISSFYLTQFCESLLWICVLCIVDLLSVKKSGLQRIKEINIFIRWPLYLILLLTIIVIAGAGGKSSEFIYFQF